jgi:hypothetical protein
MIIVPLPTEAGKEVVKEMTGLLTKFLGPGFEEAGEIVRDQVRYFRFQRELALLHKADDNVKDAGFNPRAVNMRVLFPLLDAAALEDNENMKERWASLLASAANPNNPTELEASFIEILKQLAPTHANLLDVFYEQIERDKLPPEQWAERGYVLSDLREFLEQEVPQFDVAIENLFRLNLVAYPTAKLGIANGQEVRIRVTSGNILCATSLGHAFTSACGYGRTPRNVSYGVPGNSISNVFWTRGGSLNISPSPPAKAIPPGVIPPDQKLRIEMEALAIAKATGYLDPGVGLDGRRLRVHLGKKKLPQEAIFPLAEFCAERGLHLETYQTLS